MEHGSFPEMPLPSMLELLPNPVFYKDGEGRYRACNTRFAEEVVGLPVTDLLGRTIAELPDAIPPDLAARYIDKDRELQAAGGKQVYETQVRCSDGVLRWFRFHKELVPGKEGGSPGIIGVMEDITRQKEAETLLAELDARNRDLAEERDLLNAIAETSHVGVLLLDRSGRVLYANLRAALILGSGSGPEGHPVAGMAGGKRDFWIPEQAVPFFRVLADGDPVRDARFMFGHAPHARILSVNSAPLSGAEGRIHATVVSLQDVTDRIQAEELLGSRDRILEAVGFAAEHFLRSKDWQAEIGVVLAELGRASGADRVYIFRNRKEADGTLHGWQAHEWTAPGITPQIDNPALRDFAYREMVPRWETELSRGRTILGLTETFPPEERGILESQEIVSIIVVPVFCSGEFWGMIGFDDCSKRRVWSDKECEALRTAAEIFGAALGRESIDRELRESLALLTTTIEASRDGISVTDQHGRLLIGNRRYTELWALDGSIEDLRERGQRIRLFQKMVENPDIFIPTILELFANPEQDGGGMIRLQSGTTLEWTSVPYRIEGRIAGRVWAYHDATERQRNEEALRTGERRFRQIAESIREVFWIANPERFLYISPVFEELLGIPRAPLYENAAAIFDLILPEDRPQALSLLTGDGFAAVRETSFEFRVFGSVQHPRWVSLRSFPGTTVNGIVVERVGIVEEITARKEAEAALAGEKERLAVTLRSIADGVAATDTDGCVQLLNPPAERIIGGSRERTLGRPLPDLLWADSRRIGNGFQAMLATILAGTCREKSGGRMTIAPQEGKTLDVSYSLSALRDAQGAVLGAVLVFRETGEEDRLDDEIRKRQQLESIGVLAGGIAHDFNNILTVIRGNIQLATAEAGGESPVSEPLGDALKAAEQAGSLTRQLLTFAQGGAPVKQAASIVEIIEESARFVLRGSRSRCQFWFTPGLRAVQVDRDQISQVIQNLILNAEQAMPEGGTIRVSTENRQIPAGNPFAIPSGDYVEIEIEDEGTGIPPELLDRIFDPFFSTKETGSGLGLSVVYSIINRHQGRITVDSTPGKGARITFLLPASGERPQARPEPPPGTPGAGSSGERLLLLDDDDLVREVTVKMLEKLGYRSLAVTDGKDAVAAWRFARDEGDPFTLAILDLTIPGGQGGKETFAQLRELDPAVRAIVASGYSNDPIIATFADFGFAGAVNKPYSIQELGETIRRALATESVDRE